MLGSALVRTLVAVAFKTLGDDYMRLHGIIVSNIFGIFMDSHNNES